MTVRWKRQPAARICSGIGQWSRPAGAFAQVSDDLVKIGVLTDMNGPASPLRRPGLGDRRADGRSMILAGTVLGKPIVADHSSDHLIEADIGAGIARGAGTMSIRSIVILDVPVSAVGLAVQSVANE